MIAHLGERWTYDASGSETPALVAYVPAIFSRLWWPATEDCTLKAAGGTSQSLPQQTLLGAGSDFLNPSIQNVRNKCIKRKNVVLKKLGKNGQGRIQFNPPLSEGYKLLVTVQMVWKQQEVEIQISGNKMLLWIRRSSGRLHSQANIFFLIKPLCNFSR